MITQKLHVYDRESFFESIKSIDREAAIACLGLETHEIENALKDFNCQDVEIIDLAQYAEIAAKDVRSYVIENMTKLTTFTSFTKLFDPFLSIDLWYLLIASEKSPFRSNLHHRLFFCSQIAQIIDSEQFTEVRYSLKDELLLSMLQRKPIKNILFVKREMLYFIHVIKYITQTILIKLIRKFFRIGASKTFFPSTLIFSLFPYWWLDSLTSGVRDRFFSGIPLEIDDREIAHISWITVSPYKYFRKRRLFADAHTKASMIILQDYIQFKDIWRILSLQRFLLLRRFRKSVAGSKLPDFCGYDARDAVAYEVSNSIAAGDFPLCLLVFLSLKQYFFSNQTSRILFRFERQPIDSAVIFACGNTVQSIGYWHTSLSACSNYTSFYFPADYLRGVDSIQLANLGFPKHMLVPNTFCWETLQSAGYNMSFASLCGPTRHLSEIKYAVRLNSRVQKKKLNQIAIAFSAQENSPRFLADSMKAIHSSNPNIFFLIKRHPAFEVNANYFELLQNMIGKHSFRVIHESENYLESISECIAVILPGTQLAFEAILVNTFPIVYEPKNSFSVTNFSEFSDYCFVVHDLLEIEQSLNIVLENSDLAVEKRNNWNKLYLKQFGGGETFSWDSFKIHISQLT